MRGVQTSVPPVSLPDPQPGEADADKDPADTVRRHAADPRPGALRGAVNVGAAIGAHITFDLGAPLRITAVHVRNRSVLGRPEVEDRLRGCWVQLLDAPDGPALWERLVAYGSPAYQWAVP